MRSRSIKVFVALFSLTTLLVSFQNCSQQQFQFADDKSLMQENPDLFASPQIVMAQSPEFYNSANITLSFDVQTGGASLKSLSCQLGANAAQDCMSKSVTYNALADGEYSLKIVAETQKGVKSEFVKIFKKDTTAPVVAVSAMPSAITNQVTANFIFVATDGMSGVLNTECSLDNAAFAVCTSPTNLTGLVAGARNMRIRATDRAGNVSPIYSYNWMIDLTAPTVILSANPLAITNQVNASFSFSGNGIVSYECQVDNGAYAACTSPRALANLAATNHTFRVRGTNAAGNVSAAVEFNWLVDNVAPNQPNLVSSVQAASTSSAVTFTFSSADGGSGLAGYQCSLDNAAFVACTSPRALTGLADGAHNFRVKALDNASNESAIATFAWSIQTAPTWTVPAISLTAGSGMTYDLASTLPPGVIKNGVFTVDASGAALPAGMTLTPTGILSVGTAVAGNTAGVIFSYMEP